MEDRDLSLIYKNSQKWFNKKIPVDVKIAHIRISVPETPESMSAALDNAIPQTAIDGASNLPGYLKQNPGY